MGGKGEGGSLEEKSSAGRLFQFNTTSPEVRKQLGDLGWGGVKGGSERWK